MWIMVSGYFPHGNYNWFYLYWRLWLIFVYWHLQIIFLTICNSFTWLLKINKRKWFPLTIASRSTCIKQTSNINEDFLIIFFRYSTLWIKLFQQRTTIKFAEYPRIYNILFCSIVTILIHHSSQFSSDKNLILIE